MLSIQVSGIPVGFPPVAVSSEATGRVFPSTHRSDGTRLVPELRRRASSVGNLASRFVLGLLQHRR